MQSDVSGFKASGLTARLYSSVIRMTATSHNPFELRAAIWIVESVEKLPPISVLHDFAPAICSDTRKLIE
jgi:hypothetical protein